MQAYLLDWLNLLVRWFHTITGIAWIGASFYFVWLDNHLLAPKDQSAADKGVSGELWAVNGGGFYNAQKYRVAPATLPEPLHWFKWEAYTTWISGFFLLCLMYYVSAEVYLVDRNVADIGKIAAIAIGIGSLVGGWLVYDLLCKSALGKNDAVLGLVLFVLSVAAASGLCQVFTGRAAYIHCRPSRGSSRLPSSPLRSHQPAPQALRPWPRRTNSPGSAQSCRCAAQSVTHRRRPSPASRSHRKASCWTRPIASPRKPSRSINRFQAA